MNLPDRPPTPRTARLAEAHDKAWATYALAVGRNLSFAEVAKLPGCCDKARLIDFINRFSLPRPPAEEARVLAAPKSDRSSGRVTEHRFKRIPSPRNRS